MFFQFYYCDIFYSFLWLFLLFNCFFQIVNSYEQSEAAAKAFLLQNETSRLKIQSKVNETVPNKIRRMIGGEEVSIESYPWTTLVISHGRCGGVLIDENWIITAGHCITSANIAIYYGTDHHSSPSPQNKRRVVSIYKPPRSIFTTGDLALLKLDRSIPIRSNSMPIRLNRDRRSILRRIATMAGFGRNTQRSDQLLAGQFRIEPVFMLSARDIIGARSRYQSPCYGDSGSGLVVEEADGTPYLVGITSSILAASCQPNNVALYTDIAYYYPWIMNKMGHQPSKQQSQSSQTCFPVNIPMTNFQVIICDSWIIDALKFTWNNMMSLLF